MIESVNALALGDENSDDPMSQISQILSSHLESLQWIEGTQRDVETKVNDLEKRLRATDAGAAASLGGTSKARYGQAGR